ncbi:MAG: hypothetical protein HOF75_00170 [Flavobacteriaceae bacterium]|jgi:hypothetical protein|nr:hypothetical protein [Flavobacteriaceae bacterium]MBT6705884.1 hypothetical protein [Flavobacteriaceae bacterium]MBT7242995.1 hypothetical protein [Flavobacteriaceae bacterium]|tara:strand:+ start:422 stop:1039 length:618 start_codon:yes stop_codon:yes gene_type:complete
MKPKWYLSIFVLIVAFLGAGLQQFSAPNQEIVLQFEDKEISLVKTENAIANIKKQLQDIGVKKIQVYKGANGVLKISYFSEIDVVSIKKIFSKEKALKLSYSLLDFEEGSTKMPSKNKSNTYQLDVFEIQKSNGNEGDSNGLVVELLPEHDRYFNPDVYYSTLVYELRFKNKIEKVAYIIYSNRFIEIDNSSYNTPEVRAGPVLI